MSPMARVLWGYLQGWLGARSVLSGAELGVASWGKGGETSGGFGLGGLWSSHFSLFTLPPGFAESLEACLWLLPKKTDDCERFI